MMTELRTETRQALYEYLLRMGDDQLVLGQRLAEWCGHGPILEEDIALTNISLDCFGQADMILSHAAELEGKQRSANDLAFLRDEFEFRNLQLLERPRGDFGETIARQFLYDAFAWLFFTALKESRYQPLADIAGKAVKEVTYHLRHAREWMFRLGDGTQESQERVQAGLDGHWPFTGELFFSNEVDAYLLGLGMVPDLACIKPRWNEIVDETLEQARLARPADPAHMEQRARLGQHSEHLGHMLAEMQILPRSHPGASW